MVTAHVKLTQLEVELLHRIFSARILAAPPGVEDGLRKKMARARKKLKEAVAETVDHGRQQQHDSNRVSEGSLPAAEDGPDRVESDTSKSREPVEDATHMDAPGL